jgi:hypothetical protein
VRERCPTDRASAAGRDARRPQGSPVPPLAYVAGTTVTSALADLPSLLAVTVTAPTPTAVMSPVALTFTRDSSDDEHVTTRPGKSCPVFESGLAISLVRGPPRTVGSKRW